MLTVGYKMLQDKIILNQAILRHKEQEIRQKREVPIPHGSGSIVTGTIFDCNRHYFERLLKAYWSQLYVGWNPFKKQGQGCWEVWQRPIRKTAILRYDDVASETRIFTLEYRPNDFEHWVADLDFLDVKFIDKLRKMDSWTNKSLVADHDDEFDKYHEQQEQKELDNLKYVIKHNKQAFRDLLDYTQEGFDPLQFFNKK